MKDVPFQVAERLHYLLGQIVEEGAVPEDLQEEVDQALEKFNIWREEFCRPSR